jgi:hypothetical protein
MELSAHWLKTEGITIETVTVAGQINHSVHVIYLEREREVEGERKCGKLINLPNF